MILEIVYVLCCAGQSTDRPTDYDGLPSLSVRSFVRPASPSLLLWVAIGSLTWPADDSHGPLAGGSRLRIFILNTTDLMQQFCNLHACTFYCIVCRLSPGHPDILFPPPPPPLLLLLIHFGRQAAMDRANERASVRALVRASERACVAHFLHERADAVGQTAGFSNRATESAIDERTMLRQSARSFVASPHSAGQSPTRQLEVIDRKTPKIRLDWPTLLNASRCARKRRLRMPASIRPVLIPGQWTRPPFSYLVQSRK